MKIAVSEAKAQLLDLVRRAENGEEVILTRRGQAIAKLVGLSPDLALRRAALLRVRGAAADAISIDAEAELYDESGLPH
jgi:prevent-host-death family protein